VVVSPFEGFFLHAFEEIRNFGVRGQGACSEGLCPVCARWVSGGRSGRVFLAIMSLALLRSLEFQRPNCNGAIILGCN
jgi:hypothetical protein